MSASEKAAQPTIGRSPINCANFWRFADEHARSVAVTTRLRWRLAVVTILITLAAFVPTTKAGPFADFFRELRNSFQDTNEKPRPHRATHKQQNDATASATVSDKKTKTDSPPNERNTRSTTRVSSKSSSGELKYGTPVPGKKGFVTSPFSPDAGYIDVRGFAPGTQVKDPYSGKIFLTP